MKSSSHDFFPPSAKEHVAVSLALRLGQIGHFRSLDSKHLGTNANGLGHVLAALLAPRNTRIAVARITRWQSGIEAHFIVILHLDAIEKE